MLKKTILSMFLIASASYAIASPSPMEIALNDLEDEIVGSEEQFEIGMFFYLGSNGVSKDMEKAKYWLTKAGEQRHADANFWLGSIHHGQEKAYDFYYKSARKGNAEAAYRLGEMLLSENERLKTQQAMYWFDTAAMHGHQQAAVKLSELLSDEPEIAREYGLMACTGDTPVMCAY